MTASQSTPNPRPVGGNEPTDRQLVEEMRGPLEAGLCDECAMESIALRLGYPDEIPFEECRNPGCIQYHGESHPGRSPQGGAE